MINIFWSELSSDQNQNGFDFHYHWLIRALILILYWLIKIQILLMVQKSG